MCSAARGKGVVWEGVVNNYLKLTISLITIIGAFFAGYLHIDSTYAKRVVVKEEIGQVAQRLDYWITYDQYMAAQERMWRLEDKYGSVDNMPDEIKEQYRKLKVDVERLGRKLDRLEEKKGRR